MLIQGHGKSDIGLCRDNNEDYIMVEPDLGLFLVCDGIGGHAAGEVASEKASMAVRRHVAENSSILQAFDGSMEACNAVEAMLRTAIQLASEEVFLLSLTHSDLHGMGTTCIALIVAGDKGFMGHVGDSRMYLVRNGHEWQLSQDHTFFEDAVCNGRMSYKEAMESPWAHLITRAVGLQRSVAVDTLVFDLIEDDTVLLCSDGLTNHLEESGEIAQMLSTPALEDQPASLVRLAIERGGSDNVSAVVVRALPEDPANPCDSKRRIKVTQSLQTLRHIVLFEDLANYELVRMFAKFKTLESESGEVVIREGDDADSMFVIVEGEAQVSRNGKILATLGRGAHFGEMSLLNQQPRSATVTITTSAHLLVLERELFNEVMREDIALAAKLLYKLAQILSVRLEKSSRTETEPVERRLFDLFSPFRLRK
jgi:serine/threonine protein phosphatase PrpC/CRP-like cAMP-binding protein